MEPKRFNEIIVNRFKECEEVLISKEEEYSSGTDRLHNFKVAAAALQTTPEEALLGMWIKHIVSIIDLMKNPDSATPSLIKEKFGDNINYSLLAEATLLERIENKKQEVETETVAFDVVALDCDVCKRRYEYSAIDIYQAFLKKETICCKNCETSLKYTVTL